MPRPTTIRTSTRPLAALGACALALGVCALALGACRSSKAQALRPTEPDLGLATQATARGQWRLAAERWYAIWRESGERDVHACAQTAHAMIELGDPESAGSLLDAGLALEPRDLELLDLKARVLSELGYRRAAQEYLERALEIDPGRAHARMELARLHVELGQANAAVPLLLTHVRETGGDAASYALLARALRGVGKHTDAYLAWSASFDRGEPALVDLLDAASLTQDQRVRAARPESPARGKEWLERALLLNPQSTRAHFQLGVLAELAEEKDEAIAHYRRAIETDVSCLYAITNLALLYAAQGDGPGVREMVDRALVLEHDAGRRAALLRLKAPFVPLEPLPTPEPQPQR